MANTMLHWQFRKVMKEFRKDGRLAVYLCYVLHANTRNRSWPSIETLMRETGWGRGAVVEAKDWLQELGALELVAFDKRVGDDELRLHQRAEIMQVTGVIRMGDEIHQLLYRNEELETKSPASESLTTESSTTGLEVSSKDSKVSSKTAAGNKRIDLIFEALYFSVHGVEYQADKTKPTGHINKLTAEVKKNPALANPGLIRAYYASNKSKGLSPTLSPDKLMIGLASYAAEAKLIAASDPFLNRKQIGAS